MEVTGLLASDDKRALKRHARIRSEHVHADKLRAYGWLKWHTVREVKSGECFFYRSLCLRGPLWHIRSKWVSPSMGICTAIETTKTKATWSGVSQTRTVCLSPLFVIFYKLSYIFLPTWMIELKLLYALQKWCNKNICIISHKNWRKTRSNSSQFNNLNSKITEEKLLNYY